MAMWADHLNLRFLCERNKKSVDLGSEVLEESNCFDFINKFLSFRKFWCRSEHAYVDKHESSSSGSNSVVPTWRFQAKIKTGCIALCVNTGVDPSDAINISPYARTEHSRGAGNVPKDIATALCNQYKLLQTKAPVKIKIYPTIEDMRKLCHTSRLHARNERVLFHYNGHGELKPTAKGEIWVFNETLKQHVPLAISQLDSWLKAPSVYVFDCSAAGSVLNAFLELYDGNTSSSGEDFIFLGACQAHERLTQSSDFPADLFMSCLTTPINMALKWLCSQSILSNTLDLSLIDKIPGSTTDRKTLLGELNWIFTAVTDMIAWDVLPIDLFRKLFREDFLVANLFRNFLLVDRILRSANCSPVSYPFLPQTHHHRLWDAWDMAAEISFSSFVNDPGAPFQASSFFDEQLTAFEISLNHCSRYNKPPEIFPIIVWTLPSRIHQTRALGLLCRFLDLGAWAVNIALSIGIFPYILKLLRTSSLEGTQSLLFIWTKILAFDKSCQVDLVKDGAHRSFINFLNNAEAYPQQLAMAAFILCVLMDEYKQGQEACLRSDLMHACLRHLKVNVTEQEPLFLQCLCLSLGKMWEDYPESQKLGLEADVFKVLAPLLSAVEPEVRASVVFAIGNLLDGVNVLATHGAKIEMVQSLLIAIKDESPIVRYEAGIDLINACKDFMLYADQFRAALARFAYFNKEDMKAAVGSMKQYNAAPRIGSGHGDFKGSKVHVDHTKSIANDEKITSRDGTISSSPTKGGGLLHISESLDSSQSSESEISTDQGDDGLLSSMYSQCILSFHGLSQDPSAQISKVGNTIIELIGIADEPPIIQGREGRENIRNDIRRLHSTSRHRNIMHSSSSEHATAIEKVLSGSHLEDLGLVDLLADSDISNRTSVSSLIPHSIIYNRSLRHFSNPMLDPISDDEKEEKEKYAVDILK